MGDGGPTERDPVRNVAYIELRAGKQLDQVLPHRVRQRQEQVSTDGQVVAERPDLGIEGGWIDETAGILLVQDCNRLKHIDILVRWAAGVKGSPVLGRRQQQRPDSPGFARLSWRCADNHQGTYLFRTHIHLCQYASDHDDVNSRRARLAAPARLRTPALRSTN
jgi:hypothetical protein